MVRIKISAGIIVLLIFTSIFSGIWINNECKSLVNLSNQTISLFSSGETEKAIKKAKSIEKEWKNFRKYAAILIHNNKLSEIDRICARIKNLAENNNDELLSELSELENMLETLRNGETPKITSIL